MKKEQKGLYIAIAGAVLVVILIIIAITLSKPEIPYELSISETLTEIQKAENQLTKADIENLKESSNVVFIDLRNQLDFNFNHYTEAINIPGEKIMNEEYLDMIRGYQKDNKIIVLYSSVPQKTAGPFLLLKQVGINNARMFTGTFEELTTNREPITSLHNELPVIDTTLLKKKENKTTPAAIKSSPSTPVKKKVSPVKVEPDYQSGGGC